MHLRFLAQVLLGEVIQGQRSHGEPNNFIAIAVCIFNKLMVSVMQVINLPVIAVQSAHIALGDCAIHVADYKFLALLVLIDFGLYF